VFPFYAYSDAARVVYVANLVGGSQTVYIAKLDNDGDDVLDFMDNCPTVINTDQNNTDEALAVTNPFVVGDDLGNACDDDIDGDGRLNQVDGCATTPTVWQTPLGDGDCDGWTTGIEFTLTTDPLDNCPDNASDDAWPPDMDNSKMINISDLVPFKPHFGATDPSDPIYDTRYDLDLSGSINISDLVLFKPFFGLSCTP